MKVLILSNTDSSIYKIRYELLEALLEEHEVFVSVSEGDYTEQMRAMGCTVIPTSFARRGVNPFADLMLLHRYKKMLREIKPDIVFTYTIKPNVYGGMACSSLNIPYVTNITGLGTAVENKGILQFITVFLYKLGLKKAKKVFFQNEENRDFMLERKVIRGEYDLLPGSGVNLDYYKALDYPNGDTVDFVFIARIREEKGIDQYLEAAEYIRKKYPHTRFHVCGGCEQDYEDRLKRLEKDGIVIYHGLVDDMRDIYKITSCTVHPTYYPEGLSNVLLESSASARPIITTNRSGCREVLDEGVNGFFVNQKDSKDLIEKIERFLSLTWEERRDMGLAGRRKVELEFDRNIVVGKYLKEIESLSASNESEKKDPATV